MGEFVLLEVVIVVLVDDRAVDDVMVVTVGWEAAEEDTAPLDLGPVRRESL